MDSNNNNNNNNNNKVKNLGKEVTYVKTSKRFRSDVLRNG